MNQAGKMPILLTPRPDNGTLDRMIPLARTAFGVSFSLVFACTWGCSENDPSDQNEPGAGGTGGSGDGASTGTGGSGGNVDASGGQVSGDGDGDGDSVSPPGPGMTKPPVITAKPSSGCEEAGALEAGAHSLMVGELARTYLLSLPANYDPTTPYPLIFAFHGLGNTGAGASGEWYFGIEQKGGKPSIFVYPDGLDDGGGTGWPNEDGRDVAFFDALLSELSSELCVDESRVFSTGHSYGGIMSFTLACDRADRLRAVAPVAGSRWANNECAGPVAVWGSHGNPDPTVEYEGGLAAFSRIREANGCDVDSTTSVAPTEFCTSYACNDGYPTVWCEHQSGHDWPEFAAASIKTFFDSF